MLHQECHVETKEQSPEMYLAEALIEHLSGHLRPPEIETTEHRKYYGSKDDVMEVCDHEVGGRYCEIKWRSEEHTSELQSH